MRIRAVTLDATGTLFHCPRLGEIYSEVLGRHGVPVSPDEAAGLVRRVWRELDIASSMESDRFASHPGGARGWWRRFLDRFCEYLDAGPASRFAAAELYDRFARAESWELFDDVEPALATIRLGGVRLGVVSNWDARLPGLLDGLGIGAAFGAVVCSEETGVEKPHPEIFRRALSELGVEPPSVLHVGDSRRHDVEGARAVRMRAMLLDRSGDGDLQDLRSLSEWLAD